MYKDFENTILIVDDIMTNRLTDQAIIKTHFPKLTLYEAASANEALTLLKKHSIDLVLSDIIMPDMDGFELAQKMKVHLNDSDTSIIFLTASSESEELAKRGIEVGAVDFIQRPYDPNTLVNRIKLYLNLHKKNQELHKQILANEMGLDLINRYVIVSETDLKGIITRVTDAFCEISGYQREELLGKPHSIVRHEDMPKATFEELWRSIKKGNIWSGEVKNKRKDGGFYWVSAVISPTIDNQGKHIGYISTRQDITESKKQQLKLSQREKQLKAETDFRKEAEDLVHEVIDTTSDMVAVTTRNNPIFFNRSMLKFLNLTSVEAFKEQYKNLDELFMQNPNMLQDITMNGNWLDTMHGLGGDIPILMQAVGASSKRMYTIQVKRLHTKEERYFFSFSDVTDIEDERQYYEDIATHDNLTGIYNRFFFIDATKLELKASIRDKRPVALFMIDIDHFKSINDTYGHDVGDTVLKEFVHIIKNRLRESDVLARWGGEEFIVTLPSTSIKDAKHVANTIRKSIEEAIFSGVKHLTCSIGISILQDHDTIDTMVKRADMGLYEAKASGRNCVKVIDS